MQVILKKDYEKLGKTGDRLNVKDGYALNYLIPQGIAVQATEGNIKVIEEIKRQKELKLQREIKEAEGVAEKLSKVTLTIKVKAGEEERIFGSVTSQSISEALDKKGYKIDKKQIELEEPIKHLGIFTVNIKLHSKVISPLRIRVVKE